MCKLMEKIINLRLVWFIEKINYLSPDQNGFRHHRGTHLSLIKIQSEIENTMQNNQTMGMVCLDIAKAYDTAWRPHIITYLQKILSKGNMLNFIKNFLTARTFQVKVNHQLSTNFLQQNGVPQGSTLSVTLFLISINCITKSISSPVKCTLYADDFNILCRSTELCTVQSNLQKTLNNLHEWSLKTGFKFSASKSQCIVFTRKRKQNRLKLNMNNSIIPNNTTAKVLGITFDSKNNWIPHIKNVKKACSLRINLMKMLAHTSWGASSSTLSIIHKSLILSKLEYNAFLIINANKNALKMLDTINNTGARLAIGAFRSSPIDSLLNIANVLPLHIKRQEIAMILATKLARDGMISYINSYPSLQTIVQKNNINLKNILTSQPPIIPPWTSLPNIIDTSLATFPKNSTSPQVYIQNFKNTISQYSNYTEIYTDASKSENNVGIAIIHKNEVIRYKLPTECSIHSAEAIAILKALEYALEKQNHNYIILSDSLSTISSIANTHKPNDIAKKIHLLISSHLSKGNAVKIMWVPGHSSIEGNEKADIHAKHTASSTSFDTSLPITAQDTIRMIKCISKQVWQKTWANQKTKLNEIKSTIVHWPNNQPNRKKETIINRLRIGHTRITHGYLMSREEPPSCTTCGVVLTIKHILTECLAYSDARNRNQISNDLYDTLGPVIPSPSIFIFLQETGLDKLI